jgi:hypothetical protein
MQRRLWLTPACESESQGVPGAGTRLAIAPPGSLEPCPNCLLNEQRRKRMWFIASIVALVALMLLALHVAAL